MGMAQMGIPDFQRMQNSNSAIPSYLSLNADRNVKGTPGRGSAQQKKEQWGAAGIRLAAPLFFICRGHHLPSPLHFGLHLRTK